MSRGQLLKFHHAASDTINTIIRGSKKKLKRYTSNWKKTVPMHLLKRIPGYAVNCPSRLWITVQNLIKMASRMNTLIELFSYSSSVILLIALGIGLYTRWLYTNDTIIIAIACTGLFVFSIAAALVYYFGKNDIGYSLARLYIGCIMGILTFTQHSTNHNEIKEETMNILIIISLCVRWFWNIVERILKLNTVRELTLIDTYDSLEMLGMAVASVITGKDFLSVSLLILSLQITVTSIRLKSLLGLINLFFLIIISGVLYFPVLLNLKPNLFTLICFTGRISFEAIIDLYFLPHTTLERWRLLLFKHPFVRKAVILFIFSIQLTFLVINGKQIPNHKEWFIVIPIFTAFGLTWLCYHLVFFTTCWILSRKITQCIDTYNSLSEDNRNLNQIMAAKGVRHFSLISRRLVLVSLVTTILLGAIGWNTKTALSISFLCMVIPVECAVVSLLWELGTVLGGTCIGYAMVAPAVTIKHTESATILPTNTLQDLSVRATNILNTVQRFLSYHLIETYGCEYSSSGLTQESVQSKLKAFFERTTVDGPKYDTYLLYYSGSVYDSGDWALAGNAVLKLQDILDIWNESGNNICGSRLILVLDTEHSQKWARHVSYVVKNYVAIQTCKVTMNGSDPEGGQVPRIGNFSTDWMDYNGANISDVDIHDKSRPVKLLYGVSNPWTKFTFHKPTEDDIVKHWNTNFPKITRPLIKITNFPNCGKICCCCSMIVHCLKRCRMTWFPPAEYDTGHGFKLIRT